MAYTVTINVAGAGTPTTTGPSFAGHMWYSLDNGGGSKDYGYAPKADKNPLNDADNKGRTTNFSPTQPHALFHVPYKQGWGNSNPTKSVTS